MNTLSIFLVSSLSASLVIFFFLSRKKLTLLRNIATRLTVELIQKQKELSILQTQFRQLAKINGVLKDVTNLKK